jgi:YggT family protein
MSEFLRTFLIQVIGILNTLLYIYMWVIIIAALVSWVNPDPYNPIVRFLYSVTDPVLKRIRRVIGIGMGIDFSPMIAILGILLLQAFLKSLARALL